MLFFPTLWMLKDFASRVPEKNGNTQIKKLSAFGKETSLLTDLSFLLEGFVPQESTQLYYQNYLSQHHVSQFSSSKENIQIKLPKQKIQLDPLLWKKENALFWAILPLVPEKTLEEPQKIVFWIHNASIIEEFLNIHFQLGNDRILFCHIEKEGKQEFLFSVEKPSSFLLQKSQEEWKEDLSLFRIYKEQCFFPLGKKHLVEEWLQPSALSYLFFGKKDELHTVKKLQWQDVYKQLHFDIEKNLLVSEKLEQKVHFQVPLRFESKVALSRAELWMVAEKDFHFFEEYLAFQSNQAMQPFLINLQRSSKGEWFLFLKEKRILDTEPSFPFPHQKLATYHDIHQLFLPVDTSFQPYLRREQIEKVFQLSKNHFTVIYAKKSSPSLQLSMDFAWQTFSENAFYPMDFWPYFVFSQHQEKIETCQQKMTFDWGFYNEAPHRPDLMHKESSSPNKKGQKKKDTAIPVQSNQPIQERMEEIEEKLSELQEKKTEKVDLDVDLFEEANSWEAELEKALLFEKVSHSRWKALAESKELLDKKREAMECWMESYFWAETPAQKKESLLKISASCQKILRFPDSISKQLSLYLQELKQKPDNIALLGYLFIQHSLPEDASFEWLQTSTQYMKEQNVLKTKWAWMGWKEIIEKSQDERLQSKVKKELLHTLDKKGIEINEIPGFLKDRMLKERYASNTHLKEDIELAFQHLSFFDGISHDNKDSFLHLCSQSISATALMKISLRNKALEKTDFIKKHYKQHEELTQAWCMVYLSDLLCSPQEAQPIFSKCEKEQPEQWETLSKIQETLKQREEITTISDLLILLKLSPVYPSLVNPLQEQIRQSLDGRRLRGKQINLSMWQDILNVLLQGEKRAEPTSTKVKFKEHEVRLVNVCYFIDFLVEHIHKIKDLSELEEFTLFFEDIFQKVNALVQTKEFKKEEIFYHFFIQTLFTKGLMRLGKKEEGKQFLKKIFKEFSNTSLIPLDFIDISKELLHGVEQLLFVERTPFLEQFAFLLEQQLSGNERFFYHSTFCLKWFLPLLDQIFEICVSKEFWLLEKLKEFLFQEELNIREDILKHTLESS